MVESANRLSSNLHFWCDFKISRFNLYKKIQKCSRHLGSVVGYRIAPILDIEVECDEQKSRLLRGMVVLRGMVNYCNPLCSLCSHDLSLFPFSYVTFFTRLHGQEKSLSYYDLFNFRVLFYRCIPTLISIFSFHPTTPILTVDVFIVWADLQQDMARTWRMERRKITTIWWRTSLWPHKTLPRSHWSFHQRSQYGQLHNVIRNPYRSRQGLATNSC